jgi:hypothetical protein
LGDVLIPLIAGMTATRAHLLEWVQAQGGGALQEVFAAEAEALAGPKGKHQVDRSHHRWGRTGMEVTVGGQARDPLTAWVLEQILLGVSTRGYAGSLQAGPPDVRSRGASRSAVSRTMRGRITGALTVRLGQRLEGLELLALFLENLIGTVRHLTRNVKRWRDGAMIRHWVGLALGRAATRFRGIEGHGELATLATPLRKVKASEAAA